VKLLNNIGIKFMKKNGVYIGFIICFFCLSCTNDNGNTDQYMPTPSPLQIPQLFEDNIIPPVIPLDNPQTIEGVALGKKLFFDPILSANNTQACASCHSPQNAFTDPARFSVGIDGSVGTRNSMPLFNMAWNYDERFFWDGHVFSLEHQALEPVTNPIEMNTTWTAVVTKLQDHEDYPQLFMEAFGDVPITKELTTKALAQFERTLISANSKFDNHLQGEAVLTPQELNGLNVFLDETRGDCFHCHGNPNNP